LETKSLPAPVFAAGLVVVTGPATVFRAGAGALFLAADGVTTQIATDELVLAHPAGHEPTWVVYDGLAPEVDPVRMIGLANALRAAHGLRPLVLDWRLTLAEENLSHTQAQTDVLLNRDENHLVFGRTFAQRADGVGYHWTALGEDVADTRGSDRLLDFLQEWEGSPDHLRNLLNPNYTEVGGGVAVGLFDSFSDLMFGSRS
jgi:hypothetical protein